MAHLEGLSTDEVNDLIETILPPDEETITDDDFDDEDFDSEFDEDEEDEEE